MAKLNEQLSDRSELIHGLKQDIEVFEQQQLNMKDQLKELALDKSMLESELKIARSETSRLKKEIEVYFSPCVIFSSRIQLWLVWQLVCELSELMIHVTNWKVLDCWKDGPRTV